MLSRQNTLLTGIPQFFSTSYLPEMNHSKKHKALWPVFSHKHTHAPKSLLQITHYKSETYIILSERPFQKCIQKISIPVTCVSEKEIKSTIVGEHLPGIIRGSLNYVVCFFARKFRGVR